MAANWDEKAADKMLLSHEYRQLDALLRQFIDVHRHAETVDWVERRAAEGHVPVLYHAVRNMLKVSGSGVCRVMGSAEFRRSFSLAMYLLLRSAQDVIAVAVVQGQAPRLATFSLLRDKVFGWIGSQFPPSRWPPLREVVAEVRRIEHAHRQPHSHCSSQPLLSSPQLRGLPMGVAGSLLPTGASVPLPVWVLGCAPGAVTSYLGLGAHLNFDNPSPKAVSACDKTRVPIDEERSRVAGLFFPMIGGMSWEGVMGLGASAFLQPADYGRPPSGAKGAEGTPSEAKVSEAHQKTSRQEGGGGGDGDRSSGAASVYSSPAEVHTQPPRSPPFSPSPMMLAAGEGGCGETSSGDIPGTPDLASVLASVRGSGELGSGSESGSGESGSGGGDNPGLAPVRGSEGVSPSTSSSKRGPPPPPSASPGTGRRGRHH